MAETVRIEIPIETIDNTEPGLTNATRKLDAMNDAAGRAESAVDRASKKVSKFDTSAEKTQKRLSQWAKEKYEILLEAKDKISPVVSAVGGNLKRLAGKTWSVSMKAVDLVTAPVRGILRLLRNPVFQVGVVLGISLSLTDTINTYKGFEAAMSQVQAISGAMSNDLQQLTDKAKQMGATTKFTATESAEAFNYMAMAGWKTEDMLDGIEGILNLAAASGEDLGTTSDIVTDALTAFGLQAEQSGHFADVMAVAASNANTTVSGMGETFKYAGAMAGTLKYSIEDVALATGLMANSGIKGTIAGTALNTIFTRLSTNTSGATDAIRALGVEFFDSMGNARDFSDVIEELRTATSGYTDQQKSEIANTVAGMEAQKGLLTILNASTEDYNKLADAVNNADGAAAQMSETMLDNLQGSLTLLQSAVDGVKISFGERLSPYVRGIADWLTEQMPAIEQGLDELMDWVDIKVDRMKRKFSEITDTTEWQNADFFGKVHIAWDEFVAQPFSDWWKTTGKAKVAEIAGNIGRGIGTGLKVGLLTLLGIDVSDTLNQGLSIGASFAKGFSDGFDFNAISEKLMQGFKNLFSNALKLLPGGNEADLSSVFSAVLLGRMASPFIGLGKGAISIGKGLFGTRAATGTSLAGSVIGSASARTGLIGKSSMLAVNLGAGNLAGGASLGVGGLSVLGLGAAAGGIIGGAALINGGSDLYKAFKSKDKEETAAYAKSGALKVGGAAAGAGIGAAIGSVVPVIGTAAGALVGAGIGGIAGWIGGNSAKKQYEESIKAAQKEALAQEQAKYETQELKDALADTSMTAEEFGQKFQKAVGENLQKHFGSIHLSLAEIQEVAKKITFRNGTESLEKFQDATSSAEKAYSNLYAAVLNMDRLNWKAGLGLELTDTDKQEYVDGISSFITSARDYIESRHYEAKTAVDLLLGPEGDTDGIDSVYNSLLEQINDLGEELTDKVNISLTDGVISLDEQKEIVNLQTQIQDIMQKVSVAEFEAKMEAIKIKYDGPGLDRETFSQMQEEMQKQIASATENYDTSLTVAITNLKLQLDDGVIDQSKYDEQLAALKESYKSNIREMYSNAEGFQLQTIVDNYASELESILPELEGTTSEKLSQAMKQAIAINQNPEEWSSEDIVKWFGLDGLKNETKDAMIDLLQETAKAIPDSLAQEMKDEVFNELNDKLQNMDVSAFATSVAKSELGLENEDYTAAGTAMVNGVGGAIENADMEKIKSAAEQLKKNTAFRLNSTFASGFSVSAPVDVTMTAQYRLTNPAPSRSLFGNLGFNAAKNADGDIIDRPLLSWVGEDGPEAIIPLGSKRRNRGVELWERAGDILGVGKYAEGGIISGLNLPDTRFLGGSLYSNLAAEKAAPLANNETTEGQYETKTFAPADMGGSSTTEIKVSVSVNPEFTISGSGNKSEEDIVLVIRKHMKEMADELGGEIAGRLEEVFSNMPLKEA